MITELRELRPVIVEYRGELKKRMERRGDTWDVSGRDFFSYMEDFSYVADMNHIEDSLSKRDFPVVIDLMSPTDAVASLFYRLPQAKKLGIAVGLANNRDSLQLRRDENLGIHQIAGDLMYSGTWRKIRTQLNGQKAHLIIEASLAGLNFIPNESSFYAIMLNRAWSLLSEQNGTILAEIPSSLTLAEAGVDMPGWRKLLDESKIDYAYDNTLSGGFLRLTKTPQSPKKLPVLLQ